MSNEEKDRWTLLAEAAIEINEVFGLEPPIDTDNVSEVYLEEKLQEAAALVRDDDEFSDQTEKVLAEWVEEYEGFQEPEDEEIIQNEVSEDEEDAVEESEPDAPEEEVSIEAIRDEVEGIIKRKDLRIFAQEHPDIFGPIIEQLPDLKSSKALKGAMLVHLNDIEEDGPDDPTFEEPEEEVEEIQEVTETDEAEEIEEPKKTNKPKKKRGVIATIATAIETSGPEGISKEEILDILVENFPNRGATSMSNTINVQVPTRISKERFKIERTEEGKYRKA